ncbi:MAG TPA: PQQ-dependent catabolism-associated CXXCW motif protein [Xanthobacteraceae bacterium]|jgi:PQQ-dependent catabolism-associated CXXCW motif protein
MRSPNSPWSAAAVVVAVACVLAGTWAGGEEQALPEPEQFRNQDYRAPTPKTLKGARVITTAQAEALWQSRTAAFVDVTPHVPRPADLPPGTLWRDKPRRNIPGSVWLPDTGYGALSAATEEYLRKGLRQVTGGDRGKVLVIYCLRDCWMSWNAAKRAVALGYAAVAWYPDGSDGWQDAGLPLAAATPAPRPRQ